MRDSLRGNVMKDEPKGHPRGQQLHPSIIIKYTNARASESASRQLHEVYVKIAPRICLAIHNKLRGIHYQTITPPGLYIYKTSCDPSLSSLRSNASFLLRAKVSIPFSFKVSRRFNPSTFTAASLSPSSDSLCQKCLREIHEPGPAVS